MNFEGLNGPNCEYHVMLCVKHKEKNNTSPFMKMDDRAYIHPDSQTYIKRIGGSRKGSTTCDVILPSIETDEQGLYKNYFAMSSIVTSIIDPMDKINLDKQHWTSY